MESPHLNNILACVAEFAWTNSAYPPQDMRQIAEIIGGHVGKAEAEREMLIYWLLRAYDSGHREGWEEGPNTDETMSGILDVLANLDYDPNLSDRAKELAKRSPVYFVE